MTDTAAVLDPMTMFAPSKRADPYPGYAQVARAGALVALAPSIWLAPRYAQCAHVLADAAWGHGYESGINPFRPGVTAADVPGSIVRMDPPQHTELRALVARSFAPRAMVALHHEVVAAAGRAVAALVHASAGRGSVDAVEVLAAVPLQTVAPLLGVPAQRLTPLRQALQAVARGADPDAFLTPAEIAARAAAEQRLEDALATEIDAQIDARIDAPSAGSAGTGLVATFAAATHIDRQDLLGLAAVVLAGGYGTPVSMLTNAVLALSRHPEQAALLRRHPRLAASAADELMRYDPPVQFTHRVALTDVELAGRVLPRGTGVVVMIASANRDPAVFPEPDALDLARYDDPSPARRHLTLSLGPHFCLGAQLARMQLTAVLEALARRGLHIEPVDEPRYLPNVAIRTLDTLPVRVAPAG